MMKRPRRPSLLRLSQVGEYKLASSSFTLLDTLVNMKYRQPALHLEVGESQPKITHVIVCHVEVTYLLPSLGTGAALRLLA
jgi:hypothetical protein